MADDFGQLHGINPRGEAIDDNGNVINADPNDVLGFLAKAIMYGNNYYGTASDIRSYLNNQGMSDDEINSRLSPEVKQQLGSQLNFKQSQSTAYNPESVNNGVSFLQEQGIPNQEINNDVSQIAQSYQDANASVRAIQQAGEDQSARDLRYILAAGALAGGAAGLGLLGEAPIASELGTLGTVGEGAGFVGPSSSLASVSGDAFLPGALSGDASISSGVAQLGTGTSLAEGATTNPLSPYYGIGADASNPLMTTAGYGSSELGGTGSIIGSGTGLGVSTLPQVSAATGFGGLTAADFPSYDVSNAGNGVNAKNIARALRLANTAKNLLSSQNQTMQSFNTLNNQNQNQNLLNAQGTGLPTEYRAKNPFDFGQQQPVQDTLASLLRNNYGNS
jgi:hypothetical protein